MESAEIRKKFLDFFAKHGHAVVSSSSLIPDDPSVLLTTAGMQQFKKYYTGELDPLADFKDESGVPVKSVASIQKSFRTSDIDEVGDESHLTFFEMLGNFSFGGYWKKEAIGFAHDFITKEMGLEISYVTVFEGSGEVPKDAESKEIWRLLGVSDIREEGMEDVFWGPTGASGPCGPTTEIYCKNSSGRDVEIWNIVFNEYFCDGSREALLEGSAKLKKLGAQGIDTGMGFERLAMISQRTKNIFETDLFTTLMRALPDGLDAKSARVAADHSRGIAFLIADGVRPSNKGAGYILRRLIRRIVVHEHIAAHKFVSDTLAAAVREYKRFYPELDESVVLAEFDAENEKFQKTLAAGLKELKRAAAASGEDLDAAAAFKIYETYGLPYEIIKELGGGKAEKLTRRDFDEEFRKHQEKSRAGAEKKFGGHGLILDTGELKAGNEEEFKKVLRLHTSTHLLQRALREVLGPEVSQMGSDITPERTRFDFSFPRKLTPEEIKKTEDLVNEKIKEGLPVQFVEMSKDEAEKAGALHFFREKYPDRVKVYFVGNDLSTAWSKEFCGGPHVANTKEIGRFRIAKEESVGQGVRRVRGVVD